MAKRVVSEPAPELEFEPDLADEQEAEYVAFERRLEINRNNLDRAIMENPQLFAQVGERKALAISAKDAAADRLKITMAEIALRVREGDDGSRKLTEATVTALVQADREYIEAVSRANTARFWADKWAVLQESFKQRGYMLSEMASLWVAGYWSNTSARSSQAAVEQRQYEELRGNLKEARARRREGASREE